MSDKALADIICRALLAIVSGIRKKYGLPEYHNTSFLIIDKSADTGQFLKELFGIESNP